MKKKIFLFSALASLIIGAAATTAVVLSSPKKTEETYFAAHALVPPSDVEEYDAWLNSWSKPNH
ncbi:MAG: hypothetical protein IJQ92_02500, partial [Bacilli bacterium]|nr:hypothetical protein [Bacilli bacterium]